MGFATPPPVRHVAVGWRPPGRSCLVPGRLLTHNRRGYQDDCDYGLDGPFDYVVESEPGVIVGMLLDRRPVVRRGDDDFPAYLGNHGHAPRHGGQPVFIGTGPDFAPGADAGRRGMLDEAPTFAALLGVELPAAEGVVLTELLATAAVPA